jgi:two-component system NarL family sensor kinase
MPAQNNQQLYIAIVAATVVILLVGGFIVAFMLVYQKRHNAHLKQIIEMKTAFDKTLLQSQLEIQEQTLHIISQEIHDNVGQTLSLAKVQASIIDQSETTDKALLADVRQNIGKALSDLRDLAKSLNGDHVQLVPLKDLIAAELNRMQRSKILTATITEEGAPQVLAHQKKLILFRIIQESLQNILKHAAASAVTVKVRHLADEVEIKIADNGKGFEPDKRTRNDGLGLQNITNRAALIGGKAVVESKPGAGTAITLNIPYA